ncbi:hypothetical protein EDC14_103121 [Hydrogenispora ethanolica]|jgi:predicted nucleotidyltransferase|uniref:Polymerase nucleotidyl transferase domain-containing protein n=1 Tax=Hydrogenispora ethanolica TaxID=1082276 RepID=A0A4R1R8Z2_HYDET|nr:nucleotidyltransferase family protein [Hydrogenispora ethanolica]TCL61852.1 hypothetical protein EDC14_103121 [Hydrogenispora ethanolica]
MAQTELRRDSALAVLRKYKQDFQSRYGVTRIGFFGSVARDEADAESDVDVVVEMEKPDLFYMVHIQQTLAQEFQRPVDLVRFRDSMNSFLKERIRAEAVYG